LWYNQIMKININSKKFFFVMAVNKSDLTDVTRASEAYTTEAGAMKAMNKLPMIKGHSLHIGWDYLTKKGQKDFDQMKKI